MADTMMTFKNNDLATKFMTMDELKKACPVAFMTEPLTMLVEWMENVIKLA